MAVRAGKGSARKQSARQRRVECASGCGFTARVAMSWLRVGLPSCPCGGLLEPSDGGDRAELGLLCSGDVGGAAWTVICRERGWSDSIERKGAAAIAWGGKRESLLDRKVRRGAEHCVFAGCGLWVADGAAACSAGHLQDGSGGSVSWDAGMAF